MKIVRFCLDIGLDVPLLGLVNLSQAVKHQTRLLRVQGAGFGFRVDCYLLKWETNLPYSGKTGILVLYVYGGVGGGGSEANSIRTDEEGLLCGWFRKPLVCNKASFVL